MIWYSKIITNKSIEIQLAEFADNRIAQIKILREKKANSARSHGTSAIYKSQLYFYVQEVIEKEVQKFKNTICNSVRICNIPSSKIFKIFVPL